MNKVRKNYSLLPATVAELQTLVARGYGNNASESVQKAVHAALVDLTSKTSKGTQ